MGENTQNNELSIKFNQPRFLNDKETIQTMNHWRATAEVYYSREKNFECFFDEDVTWNLAAQNYGFTDEEGAGTLQRSAAKKAKHLKFLLTLLSSHTPWEHLQTKLLTETNSMAQVWTVIYAAFGCAPSNEKFLDFIKIDKTPLESYLTFYERLAGHIRQHLAPAGATVGATTAPAGGDVLSVTLQDFVAMIWLQRIDQRLPDVVQTEFHVRLEGGARLASLVPTIAQQIPQLLARYEGSTGGSVNAVSADQQEERVNIESLVDATVKKLNFGSSSQNSSQRKGGFQFKVFHDCRGYQEAKVQYLCSQDFLQSQDGIKMVRELAGKIKPRAETPEINSVSDFISENKSHHSKFDFEKLRKVRARMRAILLPGDES